MALDRAAKASPVAPLPEDRGASAGPTEPARHGRTREIRRVLTVVLALNVLVAAAKLGYGVVSGSVAMTADGVQSLLDGLANVVGLVGIAVASRPPDREHHYGHERYETLASMAIAGLMAIGVVEILQSAIERWRADEQPNVTAVSFGVLLGTMSVNAGVAAGSGGRPVGCEAICSRRMLATPRRMSWSRGGGARVGRGAGWFGRGRRRGVVCCRRHDRLGGLGDHPRSLAGADGRRLRRSGPAARGDRLDAGGGDGA
jgi:hypothetical protein